MGNGGQIKINVDGSRNEVVAGDKISNNVFDAQSIPDEVMTMLKVVSLLPKLAKEASEKEIKAHDFSDKDVQHKVEERFQEYTAQIKEIYTELNIRYKSVYEAAKAASDLDDFALEEHYLDLRNISDAHLEETDGNPILAVDSMVEIFVNEFKQQKLKTYSKGAVKYYLYEELIRCNVFPNPKTDS